MKSVQDWITAEVTRRSAAEAAAIEATLVEAISLQDFDHLDRLTVVYYPQRRLDPLGLETWGVASSLEEAP